MRVPSSYLDEWGDESVNQWPEDLEELHKPHVDRFNRDAVLAALASGGKVLTIQVQEKKDGRYIHPINRMVNLSDLPDTLINMVKAHLETNILALQNKAVALENAVKHAEKMGIDFDSVPEADLSEYNGVVWPPCRTDWTLGDFPHPFNVARGNLRREARAVKEAFVEGRGFDETVSWEFESQNSGHGFMPRAGTTRTFFKGTISTRPEHVLKQAYDLLPMEIKENAKKLEALKEQLAQLAQLLS